MLAGAIAEGSRRPPFFQRADSDSAAQREAADLPPRPTLTPTPFNPPSPLQPKKL